MGFITPSLRGERKEETNEGKEELGGVFSPSFSFLDCFSSGYTLNWYYYTCTPSAPAGMNRNKSMTQVLLNWANHQALGMQRAGKVKRE